MIKVTEVAQEKIMEAIDNYKDPVIGIRALANARSPFKVDYALAFVPKGGNKENDEVINFDNFSIYIDAENTKYFEGVTLDFQDFLQGGGFTFVDVPKVPEEFKGTLAEKIVQVIDEQINPQIADHGGYVSLIDVKGTEVIIQMGGGCQGCGMANVTLKNGVEVALKEAIPDITAVYDVTDHASGKNPYYKS
jgi:Fe/S biogenesis protein NfuA